MQMYLFENGSVHLELRCSGASKRKWKASCVFDFWKSKIESCDQLDINNLDLVLRVVDVENLFWIIFINDFVWSANCKVRGEIKILKSLGHVVLQQYHFCFPKITHTATKLFSFSKTNQEQNFFSFPEANRTATKTQ